MANRLHAFGHSILFFFSVTNENILFFNSNRLRFIFNETIYFEFLINKSKEIAEKRKIVINFEQLFLFKIIEWFSKR